MAANRSGTAGTASSQVVGTNTNRAELAIQNVGRDSLSGDIGVNEFGDAALGQAGTWTLQPGALMRFKGSGPISVIGSVAGIPYTASEA